MSPRNKKRAVSPFDLLLPYQRKFVDDHSRFKIKVASRQTGKSFETAFEAVDDCFTTPGETWVTLSVGERQALEWLGKAKDVSEAFKLAIEDYAEDRVASETLLKSAEITFAGGSRIIAIPANPSTARGYSANVILDEFALHEDPAAIWAAMFPSITNPLAGKFSDRFRALKEGKDVSKILRALKMRVVSTFNGKDNKFFEIWDNRKKNGFSGHLVTIYDAIKDGLPLSVDDLRAALDDPDAWAQEFECIAGETSNVLLPYDLIALAESADATEFVDFEFFELRDKLLFTGIDFGRSNDPTVCWTLERVGDILWTREVLVLHKTDTPEQNRILASRIKAARKTCLDYTGPGVGFGDYAAAEEGVGEWKPEQHKYGKVEKFVFSTKSKRLLFPALRRTFEAPTKVRVPISRAIREDLHAMQQVVTNGEYNYWAPRTREGHSDRCTALALARRAAGDGMSATAIDSITDDERSNWGFKAIERKGTVLV